MKVGFIFTQNMRNILIIILLSSSISFAQSKEEDLKEANRISDLFFGKVLNSCNWGFGLSDSKYKFDTLSIKNDGGILSFNWEWSYKGFTGEIRHFEALLSTNGSTIFAEWKKKSINSNCLPSKIEVSNPTSFRDIQINDFNEIQTALTKALKKDSISESKKNKFKSAPTTVIIGNRIYLNSNFLDDWFTDITRKKEKEQWHKNIKITGKVTLNSKFDWDSLTTLRAIKVIDNGLSRFENHVFDIYDPFDKSYNNPNCILFFEIPKLEDISDKIKSTDKNYGVMKMYIVRKQPDSEKIRDVSIRLFQMSVPNRRTKKEYNNGRIIGQFNTISYLHNNLMFKIIDFGEIPKPIKDVIHAND